MKIRTLTFDALRALPVYPWLAGGVAFGMFLLGLTLLFLDVTPTLFFISAATIGIITAWWFIREVLPSQTNKGTVRRRFDREQRAGGVASPLDIRERASRRTLRLTAAYLRPSLIGTPLRRTDPNDVGILLARHGLARGPLRPFQECWSSVRDVAMYVGGPGTNKTISLAEHGITAPGALITTSSRTDVAEWVQRARKERPVHIFNPYEKGDVPSTVRWSVLVDCDDYETAQRRAIDMLPTARNDDNSTWYEKAETLLAVLLHAAALGGYRTYDALGWLSALNRDRGYEAVERTIMNALDNGSDPETKILLLRTYLTEPEKTKGSVGSFILKSLAWVASSTARSIGDAPLDEVNLDITALLMNRETLHVIGHDRATASMRPLMSALVAEIMFQARDIASRLPGGRLDPPLTMLLDEAAVAVRLPLQEWTADAGGDGIHLIISVQSLAQLELHWGGPGAETIKGNAGAIVMFGGGWNTDDLRDISQLCGEYLATVVHPQLRGDSRRPGAQRNELRWVPVMSPAQISNMLPGQAIVLKRGLGGAFRGVTPTVLMRKGWAKEPLFQTAARSLQSVQTDLEEAAA